MRTRASSKRAGQGEPDEVQTVVGLVINERPQKRIRRTGLSQPMRGDWDELPHNLGTLGLTPKKTDTPITKVSHGHNIVVSRIEQEPVFHKSLITNTYVHRSARSLVFLGPVSLQRQEMFLRTPWI